MCVCVCVCVGRASAGGRFFDPCHEEDIVWRWYGTRFPIYTSLYPFLSCSSRWIAWSSLVSSPFHPEPRTPFSPDRLCPPPTSPPSPFAAPSLAPSRSVGTRFTIFALTLSTERSRLIDARGGERGVGEGGDSSKRGRVTHAGRGRREGGREREGKVLFFRRFRACKSNNKVFRIDYDWCGMWNEALRLNARCFKRVELWRSKKISNKVTFIIQIKLYIWNKARMIFINFAWLVKLHIITIK